jgi:MFS transporter, DHA3 family, macrolide efflux protein
MENILKLPLILSFAGASLYGVIISVGGAGMLVGSLTMSLWGGPERRVYGVYLYGVMLGLGLVLESLRHNAWLIGIATFLIAFVAPVANGTAIPILQTKTALALQGRVFSAVRFITGLAVPLAYILAGRLDDKVFEPLMARNHTLRMTIGRLIGVGPGRGTALLLFILGIFAMLATLKAVGYRPLSRVEIEIPDADSATPNVA